MRNTGRRHSAAAQVATVGALAFCGPGLFNALNGLGNAGSDDATVSALANGCLYCTFAVCGYLGGAAFNLFGPLPLLSAGGLTYAVYAACIYFSAQYRILAVVGGVVLGVGAGLFWTAQGSLMMAYATPNSRGRLIAVFWMIFNLGGVMGGILQFGMNYQSKDSSANPVSYFAFVATMVLGAVSAPMLLASPSEVIRQDGSEVSFDKAESPSEEIRAAFHAFSDPFLRNNVLFYLASNWFYTYNFNGFNGHQFNVRTRGLNSAMFWLAQMIAAWLFAMVLDGGGPPRLRAAKGLLLVAAGAAVSLGLALYLGETSRCNGTHGWDKGHPCRLDYLDGSGVILPMLAFLLLGASDAIYQSYAYWLMSTVAAGDGRRTVMYSAAYKGIQSLGAGVAWLIDLPVSFSYQAQGTLCFLLAVGACAPVMLTFRSLDGKLDAEI
mmetsp:Transcript_36691/g.67272  ORF Transcript_36691/g.67272 Transcript_36691/m.67272 type:complete len:437 (-) Transcript_36691:47-1357(-)